METDQLDLLLRLIIAHILADFVFQTKEMALGKKNGLKTKHLNVHILIVGLLAYLLLGEWTNWFGPLLIMLVHGLIDLGKSRIKKDSTTLFLTDQAMHILTLVIYCIVVSDISVWELIRA